MDGRTDGRTEACLYYITVLLLCCIELKTYIYIKPVFCFIILFLFLLVSRVSLMMYVNQLSILYFHDFVVIVFMWLDIPVNSYGNFGQLLEIRHAQNSQLM